MTLLTTGLLRVSPTASAAPSVTAGSAWVYGSWVQVHAGVSDVTTIVGLFFELGGITNTAVDVDLGTGLSGSEISLGSPIRIHLDNTSAGTFSYMLPFAIAGLISAGARIVVRLRSNTAGLVLPTGIHYYMGDFDSDVSTTTWLTKAAPTAADPVTATTPAASWNNSTWTAYIASLTNDAYVYGVTTRVSNTGSDWELDIGTGGAGSETAQTTVRWGDTVNDTIKLGYQHLPALFRIAAGTRVSFRVRQSLATAKTVTSALLFLDAPAAVTPPTPAADYPCNIVTPQYWGAINAAGGVIQFAKQPLRDSSSYYGGFKAPRLIEMGQITRNASDFLTGAWQAQTATMKLADVDRLFRGLTRQSLRNSNAFFYLISEAQRQAGGSPALLFQGPIYDDSMAEHLSYTITANDYVSAGYNLFKEDRLIPQRTVARADFPACPSASINLGVPIIGGEVSDEGAGTPTGLIKLIDVGDMTIGGSTYGAALVAGHACASVLNLYQNNALLTAYGTDVWAPGHASWSAVQPSGALFFDINGNRYTLIFVKNTPRTNFQNGSKPIYANVRGIEPNADGTGTYITDLLVLYKYLLVQFITQNYKSGSWLSGLTFTFYPGTLGTTATIIDESSFTAASTIASTYLGGGFIGGFVIGANGKRVQVRTLIGDANVSCNVFMGYNSSSQIAVKMFSNSKSTLLGSTRTITDRRDILKDPAFSLDHRMDWFINDLAYQYAENYREDSGGQWNSGSSQGNAPSQVSYGVSSGARTYALIRDSATADAVAGQHLAFGGANPPRIVTWAQSLCGLAFDIMTGIPITHYNGPGNGWVANPVFIIGQTLDPKTCTVHFTGVDVNSLVS